MKQFNKGDLVTSANKYSEAFEKEGIYVGITHVNNGNSYHVVGIQRERDATTMFVEDDYIELLATVKHIPIPKFHKGDKAFWRQQEVIIVEERDEDLCYLCYNQVRKVLVAYAEKDLLNEEELEKTLKEDLPKAEVEKEI